MLEKSSLQDVVLAKLQEERQVVTVVIRNGYQMKGRITAFDQSVIVLEIKSEQNIIYKHAVSTIIPGHPIDLDSLREEGL